MKKLGMILTDTNFYQKRKQDLETSDQMKTLLKGTCARDAWMALQPWVYVCQNFENEKQGWVDFFLNSICRKPESMGCGRFLESSFQTENVLLLHKTSNKKISKNYSLWVQIKIFQKCGQKKTFFFSLKKLCCFIDQKRFWSFITACFAFAAVESWKFASFLICSSQKFEKNDAGIFGSELES